MLDRPVAGRVREPADSVFFQRHSFDFYEYLSVSRFHIQVEPGGTVDSLRPDQGHIRREIPLFDPFSYHLVRDLGIHIDEPFPLFHRDQIPFGFPRGISAFLHIDYCSGNQQFRTAPCIFYMNRLFLSIDHGIRNKPVRPLQKNSLLYPFIFHNFIPALLRLLPGGFLLADI